MVLSGRTPAAQRAAGSAGWIAVAGFTAGAGDPDQVKIDDIA